MKRRIQINKHWIDDSIGPEKKILVHTKIFLTKFTTFIEEKFKETNIFQDLLKVCFSNSIVI